MGVCSDDLPDRAVMSRGSQGLVCLQVAFFATVSSVSQGLAFESARVAFAHRKPSASYSTLVEVQRECVTRLSPTRFITGTMVDVLLLAVLCTASGHSMPVSSVRNEVPPAPHFFILGGSGLRSAVISQSYFGWVLLESACAPYKVCTLAQDGHAGPALPYFDHG